jgi:hypothetical protein
MERRECVKTELARSKVCGIEVCGCGAYHVTIGAVTLRFARQSFDELATTLTAAMLRASILEAASDPTDALAAALSRSRGAS